LNWAQKQTLEDPINKIYNLIIKKCGSTLSIYTQVKSIKFIS
jgi:hypothetical protein